MMKWIGLAIAAIATASVLFITSEPKHTLVMCEFKNMTKAYRTTQAEANDNSFLITVYQGNRIFMFPRTGLTACYDLDKEDNETP